MSGALREPWRSLRRQREAAAFGTWIFLGGEAMLFAGLILAFAVMRALHPAGFILAGRETEVALGTANTAILLTSSLTMAVAAEAARAELRRATLWGMGLTLALGAAFLAVKGFEWSSDLEKHLFPGDGFALAEPSAQIFFALYWIMTSLHAMHMLGGMTVVAWLGWQAWRRARPLRSPAFEAAALYWHLVDIVWIVLYPLLYLGGRAP
ncbi:cytochrome c oxidase subunit 3 [Pararoseomonas indoligenes]